MAGATTSGRAGMWTAILAGVGAAVLVGAAGSTGEGPSERESEPTEERASQTSGEAENASDADQESAPAAERWTPPTPASVDERRDDRERMVRVYLEGGHDPVEDGAVLEAMATVPRHEFVPEDLRRRAYANTPLPIGHGQTISQPYIVGKMTELLGVEPGDRVLEIGTGSGYQAAVLAQLTPHVYTIEIIGALADRSAQTLEREGYDDVESRHADGYFGWEEHGPFDRIIVTAAAGHVPPPLWKQLKPGGRMVIPIGGRFEVQRLVVVDKTESGERASRSVMAVRFVPFTRGERE